MGLEISGNDAIASRQGDHRTADRARFFAGNRPGSHSRANISFKTISGNLKRSSWQWDYDQFRVNQIGHPFQDLSLSWYRTFVLLLSLTIAIFLLKNFREQAFTRRRKIIRGYFPRDFFRLNVRLLRRSGRRRRFNQWFYFGLRGYPRRFCKYRERAFSFACHPLNFIELNSRHLHYNKNR